MKSKKQKVTTLFILLLLFIPAIYLGIQLSLVVDRPYKTETAIRYDLSDSIMCSGFLAFHQQEVPGEGMLGYLVKNGERVSVGTAVAEQYDDVSQANARREITELDEQLELLKKSENSSADDIEVLFSQRQSSFYDFLDQLSTQNVSKAGKNANDYLLAVNKLQITTGAIHDFSAASEGINAQRDNALTRLGTPPVISAPAGGYFVPAPAGKWLEYDEEQLSLMPPADLQNAFFAEDGVRNIEGAGKLIESYTWRFYGVCTLEESKKFENVSQVGISFPSVAEKKLPAFVETVSVDEESGLAKIVLRCEYVGADLLGLAAATAQIDFESYKGLRINTKALHIVDGEKGVYVKYGNMARWRKISILYQNEEYILIPENGKPGTENEVTLFDEVIVEGTELKDGKLLK